MNRLAAFHTVIAGLAAVALAAPAAAERALRIGTDGAYPPYNATTASGELVGFEIDLIRDLCGRMARRCEFVTTEWIGMIPKLQQGSVDIIMSALSIRPERRKAIDFSLPYFSAPTYFLGRKSNRVAYARSDSVIDLSDPRGAGEARRIAELERHLEGAVLGVEGSTTHEDFVRSMFPRAGRIRIYPKQENLFLDLVIGRVDAVVVGFANTSAFIAEEHERGREFVRFGPGFRGGPLGEGVAFGLHKRNDALEASVNAALLAAGADGTISRLSRKWFGIDGSIHYGAARLAGR
jgi:octopine/nopaline transport system substrate-binding protein